MNTVNLEGKNQSDGIPSNADYTQINTEKNDTSKKPHPDLIKEQYAQYYQMVRHHTSLSWHIPSFTIACSVLFLGLDSSKMQNWFSYPIIPATCFFVICLFLVVMLVHHKRNGLFASRFDTALIELEECWGVVKDVHHKQKGQKENFKDKISSSVCLTYFLVFLITISLFISIYFLCKVFM